MAFETTTAHMTFCELTSSIGINTNDLIGPSHSLYYWHENLSDMQCSIEMRKIRAALDKITEAVVAAEKLFVASEAEDEEAEADCTCRTPTVHSTDIDPPEPRSIRDPWCPVHGKDPDQEYERKRDDAMRDNTAGVEDART